jgi:hypothetical protein
MGKVPYFPNWGDVDASGETAAEGEDSRCRSAFDAELGQDVGDMVSDSFSADRKSGGNLPI